MPFNRCTALGKGLSVSVILQFAGLWLLPGLLGVTRLDCTGIDGSWKDLRELLVQSIVQTQQGNVQLLVVKLQTMVRNRAR